jgi:hypothetical protein
MNEKRRWETSDIGVAAYIFMNDVEVLGAVSDSRRRFRFIFNDEDGVCDTLKVSYVNSESARFDNAVRTLKKLCYQSSSDRG